MDIGVERRRIANDYFETSFRGYLYYAMSGDKWVMLDRAIEADLTKPLKGVDDIEEKSSAATFADLSSTLEESNSTYVSAASRKVLRSYWLADDTATSKMTFKFDQSKGWPRQGETELSDTNTLWKLNGKKFATEGLIIDANGPLNAVVTFGDCAGG